MHLNYSSIEFDSFGRPSHPEILLQTLDGRSICVLSNVFDLKINIKHSELSEITFSVPAQSNGIKTVGYDSLTGYKLLYTKNYGIFIVMNPSTTGDGLEEVKHITGYSLEKELDAKKFFIEDGTFNFWNPASPADTVLGRIFEIASGWSPGYISPSLIGRYRTFDSYNDYLLPFMYNTAPEKFRCAFVFDPYKKEISAYDIDDEIETLPIYLDFDNLVQEMEVTEMTDELVTAIRPYGSDDLNIVQVNPLGTNWMYDLSFFISNGDIEPSLADKWRAWQSSIVANQEYYKGLVGMRSVATSKLLTEQAALVDLKGELDDLVNQQSVTIQIMAEEITDTGVAAQQAVLDEINGKITNKKKEITDKEDVISAIEDELNNETSGYNSKIKELTEKLSLKNTENFTADEYRILQQYFIEQDIVEDSFVATDVGTNITGSSELVGNIEISVSDSAITKIDLSEDFKKTMYSLSGGMFSISGGKVISGDVVRGTIELQSSGNYVASIYAGSLDIDGDKSPSGMITISGEKTAWSDNISAVTEQGVTTYEGTAITLSSSSSTCFITSNVSEYQKYSVQMELYDYAKNVLNDIATATYEFSIDSANFLFAKEFEYFRDNLELGKGIHLRLHDGSMITPKIIEFELDFENWEKLSIIFSNRFKRRDNVNYVKNMLESSYSSSRSFDASKHIYNQTVGAIPQVTEFMNNSINAAVNSVIGAQNQSVVIDGAGIHVGGDSKYQIRIIDSMIAMTEDGWATAKLAIGRFASEDVGEYWGVNADVIGGKLLIGNNLIIENSTDSGVMQFKVDATGAWLNNSRFVLQSDGGGKIIIDPKYGIVAGDGSLYTTNGTEVIPSFIQDGEMTKDEHGLPTDANFFLDISDGNAYFRGTIVSSAGEIGGWNISADGLRSGTTSGTSVGLSSSVDSTGDIAIWAGDSTPSKAPFYVKRDGTMYASGGTFGGKLEAATGTFSGNLSAASGTFAGTLSAAKIVGDLDGSGGDGWLVGCGIKVGPNPAADSGYNFYVTSDGHVTMSGDIVLGGSISWSSTNSPVQVLYCTRLRTKPTGLYKDYSDTGSTNWHKTMTLEDLYASYTYDGGKSWTEAVKIVGEDGQNGEDGSDATVPTYITETVISKGVIQAPTVQANNFSIYPTSKTTSGSFNLYGNNYDGSAHLNYFRIEHWIDGMEPYIHVTSPALSTISWQIQTIFENMITFSNPVNFTGLVDFSQADVRYLNVTAKFA